MATFEPKPFGRYMLIDKLAVGGMAEIYKAKTVGVEGFEKLLAIKRILPHCSADKEFITMLVDEAKLTVLLSHANIVQVYDLGKIGDDYFISMEFIHGTNLREIIRRIMDEEGKIPEELAVYIVSEICKGLDYAHRKADQTGQPLNIVHRDINPQNVLVSYEGEVKIVDFGIAKAALNVSHTMAGVLKGKIAYMSPEQALGKPLDGRTDIYSAGLVLYEMLTGEKLFVGETQFEVLNKIRTTRINTMDLPEEIPGPLKAILAKALAYNAKDRYQSAGDLHLELTKYLYSSYIDFSPRQLAALVRKYFGDEMRVSEDRGPQIDEKTRSLLIKTGAIESLVSEDTDSALPAPAEKELGAEAAVPEEKPQEEPAAAVATAAARKAVSPKTMKRAAMIGGIAALLLGAFAWNQLDIGGKIANIFIGEEPVETIEPEAKPEAEPEPAPVAQVGAITVSSDPSDAKILLNGKDTGQTTPATLRELSVGDAYKVQISKEHFKPFEKELTLKDEDTIKVHGRLAMLPDGALEIKSKPEGAKIILDGKDTGKVTPATIDGLELKKKYAVSLQMEGHEEWSDTKALESFDPLSITATLKELPKPPPEPEPPAIPLGSLEVRSSPGSAKVLLNGKDTGMVTPTQLEELELNKFYTIELRKDGYQAWSKSVRLAQESGDKIVASLEPTAAPKAPAPTPTKPAVTKPAPAPRPAPAPEPTYTPPPAPAPTVAGKPATLELKSDPSSAEVYVNGQYKGTTPLKVSGLSAGSASVQVKKYGYLEHNSSVSLKSGEKKNLGTIRLEGLFGELKIESQPPRATVIFDGQRISSTPVTVRRVPRNVTHTLQLELGGYKTYTTTVDMSKEKNKKLNITLQKK